MWESRRWISSAKMDVDAFLLTDRSWFLFAYIKDESAIPESESLIARFTDGPVAAVGRALKGARGSRPLPPLGKLPEAIWAREGWLQYKLEAEGVLNPGLFLDQRLNRLRLVERIQKACSAGALAPEDGFLNLFSFTGAFTMAALCAGARDTTSVDVSARYLSWEKLNFDANFGGLGTSHRLIREDAMAFLERAARKGARYRWIVIDPPTFARGDKRDFRAREGLLPLAELALGCLPANRAGAVFVSTNDAGWESARFRSDLERLARARGARLEAGRAPPDFGPDHPLKSAWLLRGH